jgi:hypothetical protein
MSDRDWITDCVGPEAWQRLTTGLTGTQLQSLLLEVMQRRAQQRTASEVLAQYQRDGFCQPASADLRVSLALDQHFLEVMPEFQAIELSPVAPLAACSAVALTDQNRVLSALRGCEVVSDPTNVLALECATRLRERPSQVVHLATSQRVIRAQPHPKLPGFAPHFRLFALASAGREVKDHGFTVEALSLHIRSMLAALDRIQAHGYGLGAVRVVLLATPERQGLAQRVAALLPSVAVSHEQLEHAYYSGGLRYQIWATPLTAADELPAIDGGVFDWLGKISSNRRAVFVASGAGTQLLALRFRK